MDKTAYSALEKRVEAWIEKSDPSVVVLYLPKATKINPFPQVKAIGSNRMLGFIQDIEVRKKFVDTACNSLGIELKRPVSLKEGMPMLTYDVFDCPMEWKRPKLSELVKIYMSKTKDMRSGYWGKDCFKPEFWPADVDFKPATTNKAVPGSVLSKTEMDKVLEAYIHWRSNVDINRTGTDSVIDNTAQDEELVDSPHDNEVEEDPVIVVPEQKPPSSEETAYTTGDETILSSGPIDNQADNQVDGSSLFNSTMLDEDPLDVVMREMEKSDPGYFAIARAMASASWEKFVDCCTFLEPIISRPEFKMYNPESINIENRFNEFLPAGTFAGKSLEQGDCLFSSLSMLLTGASDALHHHLRVGAAVYGRIHLQHFMDKIISQGIDNFAAAQMFLQSVCTDETLKKWPGLSVDYREIILFALQEEVQITARPFCYSGPLQVMFLAGFLDQPIFQTSQQHLSGYNEPVFPCTCTEMKDSSDDRLKIMWLSFASSSVGHVVPLFRKRRVRQKQIKRSDYIVKMAKPAATSCAAKLKNMCLNIKDNFMVQCKRCSSWLHPACMGIPAHVYKEDESLQFYCCWGDSEKYRDFPVIRLGEALRHDLYLGDVISIQPGNWISDLPLDILCRHLNKTAGNISFVFPEAMVLEGSLDKFQKEYAINDDRALLFVVMSNNHWLCFLLLRWEDTCPELIRISSAKRQDNSAEIDKICSIMNLEEIEIKIRNADVPVQETPYDCGAMVAAYMQCLFDVFQESRKPDTSQILAKLKETNIDIKTIRCFLRDIVFKYLEK